MVDHSSWKKQSNNNNNNNGRKSWDTVSLGEEQDQSRLFIAWNTSTNQPLAMAQPCLYKWKRIWDRKIIELVLLLTINLFMFFFFFCFDVFVVKRPLNCVIKWWLKLQQVADISKLGLVLTSLAGLFIGTLFFIYTHHKVELNIFHQTLTALDKCYCLHICVTWTPGTRNVIIAPGQKWCMSE